MLICKHDCLVFSAEYESEPLSLVISVFFSFSFFFPVIFMQIGIIFVISGLKRTIQLRANRFTHFSVRRNSTELAKKYGQMDKRWIGYGLIQSSDSHSQSHSLSHHSLARWCNHGNDFKSVESNRMESSLGTKASSEAAFNWKWNEFFVNWASIKFELITTSERFNERMSEWGKKKEKEGKKAISSNRCCSRLIAADWILIVFCLLHHLTGVAYQTRNHLSKQTNKQTCHVSLLGRRVGREQIIP